ncbi:MAG: hydrolase [Bdellovibrionaceae bacterium]|nr:hydrolase [Pseudobdellovibrionaceae bacterium]
MRLSIGSLIFFIVSLSPTLISNYGPQKEFFVVWNVGQGQWATFVKTDRCVHFDIGGEHFPARKLKKTCGEKDNVILLSHWDWDHISFAGRARRLLPRSCMGQAPVGQSTPRKMKLIEAYRPCAQFPVEARNIYRAEENSQGSNEKSNVFIADAQILVPGDSPSTQEKVWDQQELISTTRILLLGHHGSRGSTSNDLLDKTINLKIAVASARFRKYGHPHIEVTERLQQHHVPLLRTEDWGNIWLELPPPKI